MPKSHAQEKSMLNSELQTSFWEGFPDKSVMNELQKAIEDYLPGDFSTWEKDHSSWSGRVKTVDATQRNPDSCACAWSIYSTYQLGEATFGFADRSNDATALLELEQGLAQSLKALRELSFHTKLSLGNGSVEKMSGVVRAPANVIFVACAAALQDGIEVARESITKKGTPKSKENRRAAAVVAECREVYTARTGEPAPEWTRDASIEPWKVLDRWKRTNHASDVSPDFLSFAQVVLAILGLDVCVASALRVWHKNDAAP